MSEQGWRRFLAAEGVADWVVLHGGAMAVFRVGFWRAVLGYTELADDNAVDPADGRIVDDSDAPSAWILADRSGNRVCIAAWPDGASRPA